MQDGYNVCMRASQFIESQVRKTHTLVAYKCVHDTQMYNVFNTQSGSVHIVDLDLKNCSCAFQDQLQLPRKHVLFVLKNLNRNDTIDFVNERYQINCLRYLAENNGVIIPTNEKLRTSTLGNEDSNWKRRSGRRRIRRFASNGEFQRNGRVSSTCPPVVSGTTTNPSCTEFVVSGDRDSVVLDNEKLLSFINGPKPYQCKLCGSAIIILLRAPEAVIISFPQHPSNRKILSWYRSSY